MKPNSIRLLALTSTIWLAGILNSDAQDWSFELSSSPVVSPASPAGQMVISGNWPSSCVPTLDLLENDNDGFRVYSTSPVENCQPRTTRFQLPVELPAETESPIALYWMHRSHHLADYNLHGFRLIGLAQPETIFAPESGWWWPEPGGEFSTGGPGTGLTIDSQMGFLTVITQSFGETGDSEWQVGTGQLNQGALNTRLIRFANGQTLTGDYRVPDVLGSQDSIHLLFSSASTATAWLTRRQGEFLDSPLELRQVSLVRYIVDPPVMDRVWKGDWIVIHEEANGNRSIATLSIESVVSQSADVHLLLDDQGRHVGRCQRDPTRRESPPKTCELLLGGLEPTGNQAVMNDITINNIGLMRMYGEFNPGTLHAGDRVQLIRIN